MTDNLPINSTQHQGFNANINVKINNGAAATAFFLVLGVCVCVYINAKNNYTISMNYDNNSLRIGPATTVAKAQI